MLNFFTIGLENMFLRFNLVLLCICGCTGTRINLSIDKEHAINKDLILRDTYFFIPGIKDVSYIMGSTNVEVCVENNCDFDLEFYHSEEEIHKTFPLWLNTIKKLQSLTYFLFAKRHQFKCRRATGLSPFEDKYFTIKLHDCNGSQVFITRQHKVLDFKCIIYMFLGLFLLQTASSLSKSVTFYYTSGTALGIVASALLLVYVLSRFLPQKPAAYTMMLGGWSLCAYIFSRLWLNLISVITSYYHYVVAYICTTGFLTFAYCYYRGPITNPKTHNILQWAIQTLSMVLIYHGTQSPRVSIAIILVLLCGKFGLPLCLGLFEVLFKFLRKIIPYSDLIFGPLHKPRKLLSIDEYQREGKIETEKALEELRKYCQSPECSPWRTLSRIETPKRFARFVEGESHITAQEITQYEEDMSGMFESEEMVESFMSEDDDSLEPLDLGPNDDK